MLQNSTQALQWLPWKPCVIQEILYTETITSVPSGKYCLCLLVLTLWQIHFSKNLQFQRGRLSVSSEITSCHCRLNAQQPCTTEDTHHWRSKVGEDCSSLPVFSSQAVQQSGTSSPPSGLKRSSTGIIWMCMASFTNNSCGLLPVDRVVIVPPLLRYSRLLHHPPLTGILVFLQSHFQSLQCRPGHSSRGYDIPHWR